MLALIYLQSAAHCCIQIPACIGPIDPNFVSLNSSVESPIHKGLCTTIYMLHWMPAMNGSFFCINKQQNAIAHTIKMLKFIQRKYLQKYFKINIDSFSCNISYFVMCFIAAAIHCLSLLGNCMLCFNNERSRVCVRLILPFRLLFSMLLSVYFLCIEVLK